MKVTTNTDDLLIIDDRPLFFSIMLGGFILVFTGVGLFLISEGVWAGLIFVAFGIFMGGGAFYIFVQRVQVVLHRPEGWFEIRRKTLFSTQKVRYRLSELSHAGIETSRSSDGTSTYRVVLRIPEGESVGWHPVTIAYSNGRGHHRCRDAINAWLGADGDVDGDVAGDDTGEVA